jgi:hypothetical protein
MPNQWYAAKNPANEYDRVGYSFSNLISGSGCGFNFPGHEISISDISAQISWDKIGAVSYDYDNYFRTAIIDEPFFELSSAGKSSLVGLIDSLVIMEEETDYTVIKSEIIEWEASIIQGTLDETDKRQLLIATSLLRYATLIYLPTGNEQTGNISSLSLSNVWKWLAFAVFIAVCALVVGPLLAGGGPLTVGGYLIWAAVGATIGLAVVELDIFN